MCEAVGGCFEGLGVLVGVGGGEVCGFPGCWSPVWVGERFYVWVIGHGGSKKGRSEWESGVLGGELMIEWGYE